MTEQPDEGTSQLAASSAATSTEHINHKSAIHAHMPLRAPQSAHRGCDMDTIELSDVGANLLLEPSRSPRTIHNHL
jgi:hypothetical protein